MDWQNEQQVRRTIQSLDHFEPDPAIVKRVEAVCLERIRSKERKQSRWRIVYRSSVGVACLVALAWSFSASGQRIIHQAIAILNEQPSDQRHEYAAAIVTQQEGNQPPIVQKQVNTSSPTIHAPSSAPIEPANKQETQSTPNSQIARTDPILAGIEPFMRDLMGDASDYQAMKVTPAKNGSWEVDFYRTSNGKPLPGSKISVTVDGAGKVKRLVASHPIGQEAIARVSHLTTAEELTGAIARRLTLYYSESSSVLAYELPKLADLDARSGKFIGLEDITSWRYPHGLLIKVEPKNQDFKAANEQMVSEILLKQTGIDTGSMHFVGSTKQNGGSQYVWENGKENVVKVQTASDGRITQFSLADSAQQLSGRKKLIKVSEGDARALAVRFLSNHLPDQISALYLREVIRHEEDTIVEFRFNPAHQTIPIRDYEYVVTMDMTDGRIIGFTGDFARVPKALPDPSKVKDGIQVIEQYLKQYPPILVCTPGRNEVEAPDFVYSLPQFSTQVLQFDARTGEVLDKN